MVFGCSLCLKLETILTFIGGCYQELTGQKLPDMDYLFCVWLPEVCLQTLCYIHPCSSASSLSADQELELLQLPSPLCCLSVFLLPPPPHRYLFLPPLLVQKENEWKEGLMQLKFEYVQCFCILLQNVTRLFFP